MMDFLVFNVWSFVFLQKANIRKSLRFNITPYTTTARLKFFENCRHLIRTLPALAVDEHNPNDCATDPHELTHAPDALRYFFAGRPSEKRMPKSAPRYDFNFQKPKGDPGGRGKEIKVI